MYNIYATGGEREPHVGQTHTEKHNRAAKPKGLIHLVSRRMAPSQQRTCQPQYGETSVITFGDADGWQVPEPRELWKRVEVARLIVTKQLWVSRKAPHGGASICRFR